jgi:AbrB family looped-hinge helix DNA binding protein
MKSIVSEKGQMTIPKALRLRLGIRTGQVVEVREERGRLVVVKAEPRDAVDEVFGILKIGRPTDALLATLRGRQEAE